jgi:hypothetical protein
MEDILGEVTRDESSKDEEQKVNNKNKDDVNIFVRFGNLFKFGADDEKLKKWKEFPWEDTIIKTDVIKKWE